MSYSFNVIRASKADVAMAVCEELDKVNEAQPVHKEDTTEAVDAVKSLIDLMADDPARDIIASVSGSIWKTDAGVRSLGLSINLSFVARAEKPAEIEDKPEDLPEAKAEDEPAQG